MPEENLNTPDARQFAGGNSGPVVQIAGSNTAPITISRRLKLPCIKVSTNERAAARKPLWAYTPTPQQAVSQLGLNGIAVIVGEHGTGRRTSAIAALENYLSGHGLSPQIYDVAADWDDTETPHPEVLPEPIRGNGYILDATSRHFSTSTCVVLASWAEELHAGGACAVVIGSERDWRGDTRFQVPSVSPDPARVAYNHLVERLGKPAQAQWLHADTNQPSNRSGFLRGSAQDQAAGIFSNLITRKVSPSDAVEIAERLAKIDPHRVSSALQKLGDRTSEAQELGKNELSAIRDEVLRWTNWLEKILTESGTRGPDRIMLLSAAYLEGAPIELCIKAASEFHPGDEPASRRYREGRSPRRRMMDVGVDVTPEDKAQFESRPGLALSAIRMDWHHWADERSETKEWLERITAPNGVAADWAKQIGERLLDLSCSANDPPFFKVMETWVGTNGIDNDRLHVIAHLLTKSAQCSKLIRETHKKLLEWSHKGPQQRQVVALVCNGSYGLRWPHIALVRLRHLLSVEDEASELAANALIKYATMGGDELIRIVDTIEGWIDKYRNHPASARAFLALVNPSTAQHVLSSIITLAQTTPRFRDFLVTGWCAALEQAEVSEQAYLTLLAWARSVEEGSLSREFAYSILTDVRSFHTPVDAMSRFLYGNPEQEDPALISARFALANLRPCAHATCPNPSCPISNDSTETPLENRQLDSSSHISDGSTPESGGEESGPEATA